jgi:hypothetical protein
MTKHIVISLSFLPSPGKILRVSLLIVYWCLYIGGSSPVSLFTNSIAHPSRLSFQNSSYPSGSSLLRLVDQMLEIYAMRSPFPYILTHPQFSVELLKFLCLYDPREQITTLSHRARD